MITGSQSNFKTCLKKYRTLQLLSDMHNSVFRNPAMAATVGCVTIGESFALYPLIASASVVPLPLLVLFANVSLDFFIAIVGLFKIMSFPFTKSVDLLNSLQRINIKPANWVNRYLRSCSPSKLTLGDGRFFDRSTSLLIWAQCVDLLITFLLM